MFLMPYIFNFYRNEMKQHLPAPLYQGQRMTFRDYRNSIHYILLAPPSQRPWLQLFIFSVNDLLIEESTLYVATYLYRPITRLKPIADHKRDVPRRS